MRALVWGITASLVVIAGIGIYNLQVLGKGYDSYVVFWGMNAIFGLILLRHIVFLWDHRRDWRAWPGPLIVCIIVIGFLALTLSDPPKLHR